MPKDRVEAAIKRAQGKEMENFEEILYEGYGPHGVAILVETATDNHVRTVANVKSHFNKGNGTLGNSGSVSFQFKKMGTFKMKPEGLSAEDLELELIDFGLEELGRKYRGKRRRSAGDQMRIQRLWTICRKHLKKGISYPSVRKLNGYPTTLVELDEEQAQDVLKLVDRLEQDEDVQKVFHNLK